MTLIHSNKVCIGRTWESMDGSTNHWAMTTEADVHFLFPTVFYQSMVFFFFFNGRHDGKGSHIISKKS